MKQHTLKSDIRFEGKGLHTGRPVRMTIHPAAENSGIRFIRTDLDGRPEVLVSVLNARDADRHTTLAGDGVEIWTPEHLLSAFAGMRVDNALIEIDSVEVPILDGSAKPYADAIAGTGLRCQESERKVLKIAGHLEYEDPASGSRIVFDPSDKCEISVTVDFSSKVLGVQDACYSTEKDYASEIASARTFCFLSEIKPLLDMGLIKGGDLDNALVIDEPAGYYGNCKPYFENECARHKLLDLMGDLYLEGIPVQGRISAYKPGHKFNAKALLYLISNN